MIFEIKTIGYIYNLDNATITKNLASKKRDCNNKFVIFDPSFESTSIDSFMV